MRIMKFCDCNGPLAYVRVVSGSSGKSTVIEQATAYLALNDTGPSHEPLYIYTCLGKLDKTLRICFCV